MLEGSLLRGEERLAKLRERTAGTGGSDHGDQDDDNDDGREGSDEGGDRVDVGSGAYGRGSGSGSGSGSAPLAAEGETTGKRTTTMTTFSSLNAELMPPPKTREEGLAQWEAYLRDRFIRGEDDEFDYALVDDDDEFDVLDRVDREEAWYGILFLYLFFVLFFYFFWQITVSDTLRPLFRERGVADIAGQV